MALLRTAHVVDEIRRVVVSAKRIDFIYFHKLPPDAEKFYLKYHLNPPGLPEPEDKGYERLKNREEFGWDYIIYGC